MNPHDNDSQDSLASERASMLDDFAAIDMKWNALGAENAAWHGYKLGRHATPAAADSVELPLTMGSWAVPDYTKRQREHDLRYVLGADAKSFRTGWNAGYSYLANSTVATPAAAAESAPYDPDNETEGETRAYQAGYTRGWEDRQRHGFATPAAAAEPAAVAPEGFELIAVKGLGPLIDALDRADRKGYLPDAMSEEWEAFEFCAAAPAAASEVSDEQIRTLSMERFGTASNDYLEFAREVLALRTADRSTPAAAAEPITTESGRAAPWLCIKPQCPPNCDGCNHAVRAGSPQALVARLLIEFAQDNGAPYEDGDHPLVDEARAFVYANDILATPAAAAEVSEEESIEDMKAAYALLFAENAKLRSKADIELHQALEERDRYHDMADDLAAQIAAITGEEIGEHSSENDPWRNAMLAADEFIAMRLRKSADKAWQQFENAVAAPTPDNLATPAVQGESVVWNIWCDTCEGSGTVHQEHQAGCHVGGDHACPDCDGKGYWIKRLATPTAAPEPTELFTNACAILRAANHHLAALVLEQARADHRATPATAAEPTDEQLADFINTSGWAATPHLMKLARAILALRTAGKP